jgi:hypothetical protein
LVDSLGEDPFQLLAIDPLDEKRLYVRILGTFAETLAISDDGGLSFVQSVSFPGKLNAFLKLASGTILVAGTAGMDALGYRSKDGGQSFEVWSGAPHGHALAERDGKLYVAGDVYADGYAIADSDDEGAHLRVLSGFNDVQAVKSCVAGACVESCAYYSGVGLWPSAVCGAAPTPTGADDPPETGPEPDATAGAQATGANGDEAGAAGRESAAEAGAPSVGHRREPNGLRISGGGCACGLGYGQRADDWTALLLAGAIVVVRGKARRKSRAAYGVGRSK